MDLKKLLAITSTDYTIIPIKPTTANSATTQVENTISQVIGIITVVGIIYFAFQIIFTGYSYISAKGDKTKLQESRKSLTNSILGLTIIVVAMGLTALLSSLFGLDKIFDLNQMFTNMGL